MTKDDKIIKILDSIDNRLKQQNRNIEDLKHGQDRLEKGQQEQGKQLNQHGEQLDIVLQELAHANTAIKILDTKIDSTRIDLQREIKAHHKPKKAD